jgi:hypothetical protein
MSTLLEHRAAETLDELGLTVAKEHLDSAASALPPKAGASATS